MFFKGKLRDGMKIVVFSASFIPSNQSSETESKRSINSKKGENETSLGTFTSISNFHTKSNIISLSYNCTKKAIKAAPLGYVRPANLLRGLSVDSLIKSNN